jgi:outer membrane lipoprotein-sorting protein
MAGKLNNPLQMICISFTILVFVAGCVVTENDVDSIARELERAHNSISSLSMVVEEMDNSGQIEKYQYLMKIPQSEKRIYDNGNILSFHVKEGNKYIMNYDAKGNTYIETQTEYRDEKIDTVSELKASLKLRDVILSEDTLSGKGVYFLTILSDDKSLKWLVWLEKETFIPLKEEFYSNTVSGVPCVQEYCLMSSTTRTDIQINPKIDDSEFEIENEIPVDAKIERFDGIAPPPSDLGSSIVGVGDTCVSELLLTRLKEPTVKVSILNLVNSWSETGEKEFEQNMNSYIQENIDSCLALIRTALTDKNYEIVNEGPLQRIDTSVNLQEHEVEHPQLGVVAIPRNVGTNVKYNFESKNGFNILSISNFGASVSFEEAGIEE